jgi:hypothetical protein
MFVFACDHLMAVEELFLSIRPIDPYGLETSITECDVS